MDLSKSGPNQCINSKEAISYFNQHDVIKAIHVQKHEFNWTVCNYYVLSHYERTRPNLPRDTYPFLTDHIRVLIYNGDWDAAVPYTDNIKWTKDMGFKIVEDWHQWFYNDSIASDNLIRKNKPSYSENTVLQKVGGYAIRYAQNFTFITIRGGNHMVPETAPESSFEMMRRFLSGEYF